MVRVLSAFALATFLTAASAEPIRIVHRGGPSDCDDLSTQPVRYGIDYQSEIQQGIFEQSCSGCHTGGGQLGGLALSYQNLVNVLSSTGAGIDRVEPGNPQASFLFRKINCFNPGQGQQMPLGANALTAQRQALIYDWIASGALANGADQIFGARFEPRFTPPG